MATLWGRGERDRVMAGSGTGDLAGHSTRGAAAAADQKIDDRLHLPRGLGCKGFCPGYPQSGPQGLGVMHECLVEK